MATNKRSAVKVDAPRRTIRDARFWRDYHDHRYAILFYTLLFTLAAMPIAASFKLNVTAIETLLGISLIAAVMPLGTVKSRRLLLAGIILLLLARPLANQAHQAGLSDSTLGLWAIVGLVGAGSALRFVFRADTIRAEHIYAALSAYLLAGVFFGVTYWVIEQEWPGSFSGPSDFTRESAVYFSFVTLATLGYGDFLPKTDMVRGLVVFEVIGGQLFLAVLVARLVGLAAGKRE